MSEPRRSRRVAVVTGVLALAGAAAALWLLVVAPPEPEDRRGVTRPAAPSVTVTAPSTTVAPTIEVDPVRPAIEFVDGRHGWASGAGGVVVTRDGGRTWRTQRPSQRGVGPLSFLDARRGWAVDNGTLLFTRDGGATWHRRGEPDALGGAAQLVFLDERRGWAIVTANRCSATECRASATVLRTADGGNRWVPTRTGDGGSMCWAGERRGWLGIGTSVRTTTDGGASWVEVETPLQARGSISAIACFDDTAWISAAYGVAAGSAGYEVVHTFDGGGHWQLALGNLVTEAVPRIDAYDGPTAAVSADAAFFVGYCPACDIGSTTSQGTISITTTTDGGRTFSRSSVPAPGDAGRSPVDLAFADARHGWILARGAIYSTVDGAHSWRRVLTSAAVG